MSDYFIVIFFEVSNMCEKSVLLTLFFIILCGKFTYFSRSLLNSSQNPTILRSLPVLLHKPYRISANPHVEKLTKNPSTKCSRLQDSTNTNKNIYPKSWATGLPATAWHHFFWKKHWSPVGVTNLAYYCLFLTRRHFLRHQFTEGRQNCANKRLARANLVFI